MNRWRVDYWCTVRLEWRDYGGGWFYDWKHVVSALQLAREYNRQMRILDNDGREVGFNGRPESDFA